MLLAGLFHWHLAMELEGLPPINILHRVMTEGQVGKSGRPGSRILCPDMHPDIRKAQKAFNGLSLDKKIIVITKHMPVPLKENGEPEFKKWGDREKAQYLQTPMQTFKVKYKSCCREVARRLKS